MGLGKKAMMFTIVATILIGILIVSITASRQVKHAHDMQVIRARITTMNDFIKDVDRDLKRGLYITGFRTMLAMQEYVTKNASFIDDAEYRFHEGVINGTMYGSQSGFLVNSTLQWWLDRIQLQGALIGIDINISFINISLYQNSPWTVDVDMYTNISAADVKGTAYWYKISKITTSVPITDFEDPLYTIYTQGSIIVQINPSNASAFPADLKNHVFNKMYIQNTKAPSFLMRLEGDLSNSPMGIESIIDLENTEIAPNGRSNIDYVFFDPSGASGCELNETITDSDLSWLRMDSAHLSDYNLHCSS